MLEVTQALEVILSHVTPIAIESCLVSTRELGRVIARDVFADRDSPPFDKSLRDGYAVRSADCSVLEELEVIEEIPAGAVPSLVVGRGQCSRIFTGAPIPEGADAVVMQEDVIKGESLRRIRIRQSNVAAGQWIFRRGQEMKCGSVVVPAGTRLTPAVFGILANVGALEISLHCRPKVAIIATGNELVDVRETPGPGQIRNSNSLMLAAQVATAGADALCLGIVRDDRSLLTHAINDAISRADVLLLAGGVSVGEYDLVPSVLEELGVRCHFRLVRMKPGKPLYFGTYGQKLIFGLPGNPASSFVAFELFVRPALGRMSCVHDELPRRATLPLCDNFRSRNDRPTYHPAKMIQLNGKLCLRPLPWEGAPDLLAFQTANALLELPPGDFNYTVGESVTGILLE